MNIAIKKYNDHMEKYHFGKRDRGNCKAYYSESCNDFSNQDMFEYLSFCSDLTSTTMKQIEREVCKI